MYYVQYVRTRRGAGRGGGGARREGSVSLAVDEASRRVVDAERIDAVAARGVARRRVSGAISAGKYRRDRRLPVFPNARVIDGATSQRKISSITQTTHKTSGRPAGVALVPPPPIPASLSFYPLAIF